MQSNFLQIFSTVFISLYIYSSSYKFDRINESINNTEHEYRELRMELSRLRTHINKLDKKNKIEEQN